MSIGADFADVGGGAPSDSVLARTVLDAAIGLDTISGYEPGDRYVAERAEVSFVEAARRQVGPVRVRVALGAPLGVQVDAEPLLAARRAADALAGLGHEVVEESSEWNDSQFAASWGTVATAMMQHLVAVLERLHGRAVDPDQLEPATRGWLIDMPTVPLIDYLEAIEWLGAYARRLIASWPSESVLLTPTLTRLPAEAGAIQARAGVTDDAVRFSAFVRLWNVTGQPAISLPLHETGDGIPVGVQLVGPPGRDEVLISLAAQLEASVGLRASARVAAPAEVRG